MKIEIKKALLEGHTPEVIVEAVHINHPPLNKNALKDPKTSYVDGKNIESNRKALANDINSNRSLRDIFRKSKDNKNANYYDNGAREKSQRVIPYGANDKNFTTGIAKELSHFPDNEMKKVKEATPRLISSAKQ